MKNLCLCVCTEVMMTHNSNRVAQPCLRYMYSSRNNTDIVSFRHMGWICCMDSSSMGLLYMYMCNYGS